MKGRIVLAVGVLFLLGCRKKIVWPPIPYETLRTWTEKGGQSGVDVLVSEKATKKEVLALAEYLRDEQPKDRWFLAMIFDSKEVWEKRNDPSTSREKIRRHYLAMAIRNPKTGAEEVRWTAEGRDH
jgi:hypothetical protein